MSGLEELPLVQTHLLQKEPDEGRQCHGDRGVALDDIHAGVTERDQAARGRTLRGLSHHRGYGEFGGPDMDAPLRLITRVVERDVQLDALRLHAPVEDRAGPRVVRHADAVPRPHGRQVHPERGSIQGQHRRTHGRRVHPDHVRRAALALPDAGVRRDARHHRRSHRDRRFHGHRNDRAEVTHCVGTGHAGGNANGDRGHCLRGGRQCVRGVRTHHHLRVGGSDHAHLHRGGIVDGSRAHPHEGFRRSRPRVHRRGRTPVVIS